MKRFLISMLALAFTVLVVSDVFARAGGGKSSGMRSYQSQRVTTPQKPAQAPAAQPQPGMQAPQPRPSFFSSPIFKMIAGGLILGSLFSLLSGHGFQGFGAPGLLEILLIGGVIFFIYRRFSRSRQEAAMMSSSSGTSAYAGPATGYGGAAEPQSDKSINPNASINENFIKDIAKNSFHSIQAAWTRGDLSPVRQLMTDRMYNYLNGQVSEIKARGLRNIVEIVYFQNVELVESDVEDEQKVAVVQIDALIRDYSLDSQDRVVEGSKDNPLEIREYWAFVGKGLDWKLDDIKQAE